MNESTCAYCNKTGNITREHLWPKSLHKKLLEANDQTKTSQWIKRLNKELPNELVINDVCATCNNVTLSELDGYICKKFDESFYALLERNQNTDFKYDYHKLKRWLLKTAYNCARIHNSKDKFALEALRPYILGNNEGLGRSVDLFMELSPPDILKKQDYPELENDELIFYPEMNRNGLMYFSAAGVGEKVLRVISLRSYMFYISYYDPNGSNAERQHFDLHFLNSNSSIRKLRANDSKITLCCDGIGAWESFSLSRINEIK